MQAITTTFFPPTNKSDPRVKARAAAGSITLIWDGRLGVEGNHDAAARALIHKMGWEEHGPIVRGCLHTEQFVYVINGRYCDVEV